MLTLERWTPLRDLDAMERRLRRAFEDIGFAPALTPAANVWETDSEYVVELEVPGFDEDELTIEVTDHTLKVKGEREEEQEKSERTLRLRERLETRFERRFDLPLQADAEHVSAAYSKGVLTLHVPKSPSREPHTVPIGKA